MRITAISDLHGHRPALPGGDLLIIAGDLMAHNKHEQYYHFCQWVGQQAYDKAVVIAGNHDGRINDSIVQDWLSMYGPSGGPIHYLQDSGMEYRGLKIWGSPWTNWFKGVNPACSKFMLLDGSLKEKWEQIPMDTDILITHGPPHGMLDVTAYDKQSVGSQSLMIKVLQIRPKLHVFGHIHEGYGQMELDGTKFVNCSYVDQNYAPGNKYVEIELK